MPPYGHRLPHLKAREDSVTRRTLACTGPAAGPL